MQFEFNLKRNVDFIWGDFCAKFVLLIDFAYQMHFFGCLRVEFVNFVLFEIVLKYLCRFVTILKTYFQEGQQFAAGVYVKYFQDPLQHFEIFSSKWTLSSIWYLSSLTSIKKPCSVSKWKM